jgi:methylenetetrahydrofolate reductase (NADPH)
MSGEELKPASDGDRNGTGGYEQSLRDPAKFSITWELVPGRGAFEKSQMDIFSTAEQAAKSGRVHALTITDNPGGAPALSAEMLGAEIIRLGCEPLVHLTCKDKNRNELESLLYGMERASIRNLLVMTGDFPKTGFMGGPKPVFDLDPVNLMALIGSLNRGQEVPAIKGTKTLKPTHFFAGVAASPFKALEAEQMGQYFKLKKKLDAGAQFVVSQLGYDARKFHELLQVVKLLGFADIPVVGNIYLLPLGAAKVMHDNQLPGCVVTDEFLAVLQSEAAAADKGKSMRKERAAKMYAMMKGMGFAGAHISGHGMTFEDLEYVLDRGEELLPNWPEFVHEFDFPQPNGWYYFEADKKTGLNTETPSARSKAPAAGFGYQLFRMFHHTMFDPRGFLFRPMVWLSKAVDKTPFEGTYIKAEQIIKGITNDCMHCGDCAMLDTAYLCPQSQCPKGQRNGPCGGSFEGWCEKYPNQQKCIYVRAYDRLKSHGAEEELNGERTPPANYDLSQSSSWINFYLERDHSAKKLSLLKAEKGKGKKQVPAP